MIAFAVIGGMRLSAIAGWLAVGAAAWTLAEYWIHRAIFHGNNRFAPMHDMHHRLPRDMIGISSLGTFMAFSGVWLLAWAAAGEDSASAFVAGVMIGYLAYCAIHVRFHHHGPKARLSRYVAFMNEHHSGHHRGGKGNFGVTTIVWDVVFRTYRRSS
ncbi:MULTISPECIES: sterol desaturase family protein [unclassified Bradyrhizobium]|uniref:sterol desaturase family protein n=1 Tax=Bradyrhizobium sp. USDA 4541 TaxID=2817704 RepID=UPI0020A32C2B|nr:sterol desaturase family protein [Bradyrhizobium sp. USDA 4541]MCP1852774.1 sterol desaturase/sphingolipid hydroxylase (fatty acid hydroxylase superfamily) [Bradyrhizobium sp. USDA 4541]